MSNLMRKAHDAITGTSWLDDLARGSALVAESKHFARPERPLLEVAVTGSSLGSWEYGRIAIAVQDATAKIGHLIEKPGTSDSASRPQYREKARLIAHGQIGSKMYFAIPDVATPDESFTLGDLHVATTAELAVTNLLEILPSNVSDESAVDMLLARAIPERSAVGDLVDAVQRIHQGLGLSFGTTGQPKTKAVLTSEQASSLHESLSEVRTTMRTVSLRARVDGVRSSRRTVYLEGVDDRKDYQAAVNIDQVRDVGRSIGRIVIAELLEQGGQDRAGRRRRPVYSLKSLKEIPELDL